MAAQWLMSMQILLWWRTDTCAAQHGSCSQQSRVVDTVAAAAIATVSTERAVSVDARLAAATPPAATGIPPAGLEVLLLCVLLPLVHSSRREAVIGLKGARINPRYSH